MKIGPLVIVIIIIIIKEGKMFFAESKKQTKLIFDRRRGLGDSAVDW